ncbi:DUF4192 domain-containing protein [Nocardia altamirensis]|uniref:DUF4192 domain-containing protein n=1 Tax=Nocardia altamirensis TaxID=472158 RepID=UPI001FDEECD3|nr:DUF4192 domain-containing protein [Nocardia altamirensis]
MSLGVAMRECGLARHRYREPSAERAAPGDAVLLNDTVLDAVPSGDAGWVNHAESNDAVPSADAGRVNRTGSNGAVPSADAGRVNRTGSNGAVPSADAGWVNGTGSNGAVPSADAGWMNGTERAAGAVPSGDAGRMNGTERETGAALSDEVMPPDHLLGQNGSAGKDDVALPGAAIRPDDAVLLDDGVRLDRAVSLDDAVRSDSAVPLDDTVQLDSAVRLDDAVSVAHVESTVQSSDAVSLGYTGLLDDAAWPAEVGRHDRELVGAGGVFCADQAPVFGAAEAPDCAVHVDDPGELIAAVPAMIGFTPERSLVVLVLRASVDIEDRAVVDAVLRFDLDQEDGQRRLRAGTVARCVAQVCAHDDVAEVLAVVVDDRAVESDRRPADIGERCGTGRFEVLIDAIGRRLATQDIALAGAWAVRDIDPDERWWTLFGANRRGTVPDPASSAVALSHVLDGRRIRGTRAELTALVRVDVELQKQVAALLDSALSVARDRYARAVRHGDPISYSRQALEYVLWQIANTESDVDLMAPELAELAAALRDRSVRDAMFALAVGEHAEAAEALWATLTRALSGGDRAEAAALLGYSAYARGDGPMAGIALEAALDAEPDHPLALLLDASLNLGMRPEQLRRLARSGYHAAADLGIDLGAPIM